MFANKNKWFDMHPYPFQIRTKSIVEWLIPYLTTTSVRLLVWFHRHKNFCCSHTQFYLFDFILLFILSLSLSLSFRVFSFISDSLCLLLCRFSLGIRYSLYWHWCLRNVNKPRKATFQRRRRRHLHRAQMEHQMVNRIRLRKTFKHLSKCWRKKIGHS